MNSLKKRTAPVPPSGPATLYGTLPHAPRHSQNSETYESRTITHKNHSEIYSTLPHFRSIDSKSSSTTLHYDNKSYERFDPIIVGTKSGQYEKYNDSVVQMTSFGHKRSPSGESLSRNIHLAGAKLVLPAGEIPSLKPVDKSTSRPRLPPPGPPPGSANNGDRGVANGQSNESICSVDEELIAPTGKVLSQTSVSNAVEYDSWTAQLNLSGPLDSLADSIALSTSDNVELQTLEDNMKPKSTNYNTYLPIYRRCRALYDCNADNDDELEFKEGEILFVLNERTDDENWMEGVVEGNRSRRGMFPVSFVHMLPD